MSYEKLSALLKYFPTGTTEGELDILEEVFITPADYYDLILPPAKCPRVLVGRKGSGKSATIEFLKAKADRAGIPAVILKPDDLAFPTPAGTDTGTLKNHFFECLVSAVASKLGSELGGLLGSNEAKLFEHAVQQKAVSADWVQKILKNLSPIAKLASKIDFGAFLPPAPSGVSPDLVSAVRQRFTGRLFYLMIDDTDQVAAPGEPRHLNRIWSFILGVRKLAQFSNSIKCILTLRSEVWARLSVEDAGQHDQLDHIMPLVVNLSPSETHIRSILERRLRLACRSVSLADDVMAYAPFFEGSDVTLPTFLENIKRYWPDFLVKSSRERPRDVIQLVGMLAKSAKDNGQQKIDSDTVKRSLTEFSRQRAELLAIEYAHECPQLMEIMRTFTKVQFNAPAQEVLNHLRSIPSSFSTRVRGNALRPGNDSDVYLLWSLLHEAGFLNPEFPDVRQPRQFRHGSQLDDPGLVSISRWNDMEKAKWCVHPAFRSFLMAIKEDDTARKEVRFGRRAR